MRGLYLEGFPSYLGENQSKSSGFLADVMYLSIEVFVLSFSAVDHYLDSVQLLDRLVQWAEMYAHFVQNQ